MYKNLLIILTLIFVLTGCPTPTGLDQVDSIFIIGKKGSGNGEFLSPCGVDEFDGVLVVADKGNSRVAVFAPFDRFLRNIGSFGTQDSLLDQPIDVAHFRLLGRDPLAKTGFVFVVDQGIQKIVQYRTSGEFIRAWGHQGTSAYLEWAPRSIAADGHGSVYVTDVMNNSVQKFDSNGVFQYQWGSTGDSLGQFRSPVGIGIYNLFFNSTLENLVVVLDSGSNRLQFFDTTGNFIQEISLERFPSISPVTDYARSQGRNFVISSASCGFVSFDDRLDIQYDGLNCRGGDFTLITPSGASHSGFELYIADSSLHVVKRFRFGKF